MPKVAGMRLRMCCCGNPWQSDSTQSRMVALVNVKSGGRKGAKLLKILRDAGYSAYNLFEFNNNEELYQKLGAEVTHEDGCIVISCGGDGTACWTLKTIDRAIICANNAASRKGLFRLSPRGVDQHSRIAWSTHEQSTSSYAESLSSDTAARQTPLPSAGAPELDPPSPVWRKAYDDAVEEIDRRDGSDDESVSAFDCCSSLLKSAYEEGKIKFCTLPLGSGNDLSRALGWGFQYPGSDRVISFIQSQLEEKRETAWLDRWRAEFETSEGETVEWQSNYCLNYCSIGFTADISYQFNQARKKNEKFFSSPLANALGYVKFGFEKSMYNCPDLRNDVELWVDGEQVTLRKPCTTLVVLNISSFSQGADFWKNARTLPEDRGRQWKTAAMGDGLLEVVTSNHITSIVKSKLFKLQGGTRVAQGHEICLVLKRTMALDIDGEGHLEQPGTMRLSLTSRIKCPIGPRNPRANTRIEQTGQEAKAEASGIELQHRIPGTVIPAQQTELHPP